MKNLLLLYAILMCVPLLTQAQSDSVDVIYLKNGSVYRGTIIEQKPGISYKIEIMGGSIISLTATEIDEITREHIRHTHHGHEGRHSRKRFLRYVSIETTLSGMLYFNQIQSRNSAADISGGAGITFLPEIRKETKPFSFLIGASVQLISVRNFSYSADYVDEIYGYIYHGFQTRVQMPVWFRWTFDSKIPVFFQFGCSIGANIYQGQGTQTDYVGGYSQGYPPFVINGRVSFTTASMNISPVGLGIRKELWNHIELMGYIEGAPCNLEFIGSSAYKPYVQLHFGFNFGTSRNKTVKKQP
ncbi:MAG: hypothetical protein JWO03_2021 [Bacteroidetes bacterium]|nr:hypothetical protein [Bacteroidota bacterium]